MILGIYEMNEKIHDNEVWKNPTYKTPKGIGEGRQR
jgi:hypothetical protein